MSKTKDWYFGKMSGNTDYCVNFLGETYPTEEQQMCDVDDYLYENYKEDERMEDSE